MEISYLFTDPDHVMCFGKYEGKTFREIAHSDRNYTKFLVEKYACKKLGTWLKQFLLESEHGNIIMPFGKYKGLSFDQLLKKDKRYAHFIADKIDSKYLSGNSHFFTLKHQPQDILNHFRQVLPEELVAHIDAFTYSRFKDLSPQIII
jgi:uncharacterized protein (DUF3820 family)